MAPAEWDFLQHWAEYMPNMGVHHRDPHPSELLHIDGLITKGFIVVSAPDVYELTPEALDLLRAFAAFLNRRRL
jgi:hypothetical protein